ncbi:MAG: hypothetical protein HQ507_06220 [Candidatus Marinimicrobia bacterium]|nr:hypothetical protein [Candidatus Neomarinimicrobiota bacterium]
MLKLLPQTGEILIVGNVIISAEGSLQTEKNQKRVVKIFSIILVHRGDRNFTLSKTILVGITGQILAVKVGGIAGNAWIYESDAMLLHSALICLIALNPTSRKQFKIAHDIKTFATSQEPQKAEQSVGEPRGDRDRCTLNAPLSHECSTSSNIKVLPTSNRGKQ